LGRTSGCVHRGRLAPGGARNRHRRGRVPGRGSRPRRADEDRRRSGSPRPIHDSRHDVEMRRLRDPRGFGRLAARFVFLVDRAGRPNSRLECKAFLRWVGSGSRLGFSHGAFRAVGSAMEMACDDDAVRAACLSLHDATLPYFQSRGEAAFRPTLETGGVVRQRRLPSGSLAQRRSVRVERAGGVGIFVRAVERSRAGPFDLGVHVHEADVGEMVAIVAAGKCSVSSRGRGRKIPCAREGLSRGTGLRSVPPRGHPQGVRDGFSSPGANRMRRRRRHRLPTRDQAGRGLGRETSTSEPSCA